MSTLKFNWYKIIYIAGNDKIQKEFNSHFTLK